MPSLEPSLIPRVYRYKHDHMVLSLVIVAALRSTRFGRNQSQTVARFKRYKRNMNTGSCMYSLG